MQTLWLAVSFVVARHDKPMHMMLDSTGLQLFSQGEWNMQNNGTRRQWGKLHLAVDARTGEIAAHVLTEARADDAAPTPSLFRRVEGTIANLTADGAYDSDAAYQAADLQQGPHLDMLIPPSAHVAPSTSDPGAQTERDCHIQLIVERSRMGWPQVTGYVRRNII